MSRTLLDRPVDVNLHSAPQMREYVEITRRIVTSEPGKLLDWGCGHGQVTQMLRDVGVDAVAYDYWPDVDGHRRQQLEHYPQIVAHVSGDPRRLPFEDASFDAVLSLGVLEHVADPDASLDEIHRVLRPGGRLWVYKLPNRHSYLERVAKLAGLYYHGQLEHDRIYTEREAVALIARHGFDVLESRRTNVLPLTVPGKLATRYADALWSANVSLARLPGLNALATNVEVIARRRA